MFHALYGSKPHWLPLRRYAGTDSDAVYCCRGEARRNEDLHTMYIDDPSDTHIRVIVEMEWRHAAFELYPTPYPFPTQSQDMLHMLVYCVLL